MAEPTKYSGNSRTDKTVPVHDITSLPADPSEQKLEKGIEGSAVLKKPSLGKRARAAVFGGTAQDTGAFVLTEVVLPAVKSIVFDIVQTSVERMLYGDGASARRNGGGSSRNRVGYSAMSTTNRSSSEVVSGRAARADQGYQDLEFETRGDAEAALELLTDRLREYHFVTVAQLYDIAGVTARGSFQDHKWGWDSLNGVGVRGTPARGYILNLPRPVPVD